MYTHMCTLTGVCIYSQTTDVCLLSCLFQSENDVMVVVYITRILEKVVPLMAHPDGSFLSSIEEEMVKLILKQGPNVRKQSQSNLYRSRCVPTHSEHCVYHVLCLQVLQACVGCMDAVANKVTRNYKLVVECFQKFYS